MSEIRLERLRSPEVRTRIDEGWTTAVIACGAVEQHGPHLPLFVDAEHGSRLAEEIARRLGRALVAPTLRVGCSDHHLSFAGTLSLRESTFVAVCEDYCRSLARHGMRRLCFVPSHGGNFRPLADAASRLEAAAGDRCRVQVYTDLIGLMEVWKQVVEDVAGLGHRVGGHADVAESSIMLALHPDLVAVDLAAAGYEPDLTPAVFERILRDGLHTVTPNGILGDARGLTVEIGESCITAVADHVVRFFNDGAEAPAT